MKRSALFSFLAFLACALGLATLATAQVEALKDIAYDDKHAAQRLDVYPVATKEPAPVMVFFHGGGWQAGSKKHVPAFLRKANREGWLAVVSVEYRFTQVAPHPAQVDDCARSIQYIRHHAKKWNLDPERIGVCGGSAGGHLSAYIAVQDDEAKPDADDPVSRTSSRVSLAVPYAGPTDWRLLKTIEHGHPAYRQLLGYKPGTPADEMAAEKMKDVSPVQFASADDPPILIIHGDADKIVPFEHATVFEAALKAKKVTVELHTVEGGKHNVAGHGNNAANEKALRWIRRHLVGETKE